MKTVFCAKAAAVALQLWSVAVPTVQAAEPWPARPITVEVGYSGGATDVIARLLGDNVRQALGQPLVVETRAGAAGQIAAAHVAHSSADGYTLLLGTNALSLNKALGTTPEFDPQTNLTAIAPILDMPFVLVTARDQPYNSLDDLVRASHSQPAALAYSSNGVGSGAHFAAELLKKYSGLSATHVPYKGGAGQLTALLSGEVKFSFLSTMLAVPQIAAGKLRALAVTSATPLAELPGTPTLASLYPAYPSVVSWFALFGPPGLDDAIRTRLQASVAHMQQAPAFRAQAAQWGAAVVTGDGAQLRARLDQEQTLWSETAEKLGIPARR